MPSWFSHHGPHASSSNGAGPSGTGTASGTASSSSSVHGSTHNSLGHGHASHSSAAMDRLTGRTHSSSSLFGLGSHSHGHGHGHGHGGHSHASSSDVSPFASGPPSRAGSPQPQFQPPPFTPSSTFASSSSDYPPGEPITPHQTHDSGGYFSGASAASFTAHTVPASAGGMHGLTGTSTNPAHLQAQPLVIELDNDHLVLRGAGGDSEPAMLSGTLVLNLYESTNIRELSLHLEGRAKVQFAEAAGATGNKNHHFTHPILSHDWSFLQGDKKHSHTLKKGTHAFPFSFTFNGSLPSSIRTYHNDANITYRLRAVAVRSTFSTNFHAQRNIHVARAFTAEALEYNQTLEIENTWPGKVMYCLTLPHKAYAAGDEIPVSLKFMPLAKGVRITRITSVIKEYSMVHTRHSSHAEGRVAAQTKHELRDGRAYRVTERGMESVAPAHHGQEEHHGMRSVPPSAPGSPVHRPLNLGSLGAVTPISDLSRAGSSASLAGMGGAHSGRSSGEAHTGNAVAGPSSGSVADIPDDLREPDLEIGDNEIDTMITIPIPVWTTPSHSVHPVQVSHKIKWSCAISNPDGHVSELRCALPIHILAHSLLDEARAASSGTRNLLFGRGEGDDAPQIDLPSYNDHVYDRVANAAAGQTSSYVPSGYRTPGGHTPPVSRGPSRPGSPTRGMSSNNLRGLAEDINLDNDDGVPDRRELGNWADSELLLSLGGLAPMNNSSHRTSASTSPHHTPPDSRAHSRPGSRLGIRSGRSSQPGSRGGSRASSPDRQTLHPNGPSSTGSSTPAHSINGGHGPEVVRPVPERRSSSGLPGLFHLPSMTGMSGKTMKPFTSIAGRSHSHRNGSGAGPSFSADHSPSHSPMHSPNLAAQQMSSSLPRAGFSLGSHQAFSALADQAHPRPLVETISQVPSYDIASRGFLGGGVVPIDAGPPMYDESERDLERTRSDTALHALDGTVAAPHSMAAAAADLRRAASELGDGPGADGTPAPMPAGT